MVRKEKRAAVRISLDIEAVAKGAVEAGIKRFRGHLVNSVKAILAAAEQYASDLENYPKIAPKMYKESFPNVTERSWELLRKIGVHDLVPTAFFMERDSMINAVAKVPYRLQAVILGDENTAAVPQKFWNGSKVVDKLYADCSPSEAAKLLNVSTGKIRSVEEQKKYQPVKIVSDTVVQSAEAPYVVVGKVAVFRRRCELGCEELKKLLSKIEKSSSRR